MQRFRNDALERYYLMNGTYQYWVVTTWVFTLALFLCVLTMPNESNNLVSFTDAEEKVEAHGFIEVVPMIEGHTFEVYALAQLFALTCACTLLAIRLAGPTYVDLVTFVSFVVCQFFHTLHQMFYVSAIAKQSIMQKCVPSRLNVDPFTKFPIPDACAKMIKVQTNNLHMNSAIGALLICSLIVRRLSHRAIAGFATVAVFLVMLYSNDSKEHFFFTCLFFMSWLLDCMYEDR